MSDKRKDKKGRILRTGEHQRPDGRYEYKYTDLRGERQTVYSWKLVDTDSQPPDKKVFPALRIQEEKIQRMLIDGIDYEASKKTLNKYFEDYMEIRIDLKRSTRETYETAYNAHVRNEIGDMRVGDIKYSDIKKFYTKKMIKEKLSCSTMRSIDAPLVSIFKTLMRDNAIRANPAEGVLKEVSRYSENKPEPKKALTAEQQAAFIQFYTSSDKKICKDSVALFTVLFGTGLRISEALGLTWDDIDWENSLIHINHTLMRGHENNKAIQYISSPKSGSGTRSIPMFESVRSVLEEEYKKQHGDGYCQQTAVDGCSDFVFVSRQNRVLKYHTVFARISKIAELYNEQEKENALKENRKPLIIDNITPHIFRHSFCSRMVELGIDTKVLQEVMGHADYNITMNVYAQVSSNTVEEAFKSAEGKFAIA